MGTAIPLRGDFDAAGLRRLGKRGRDGAQNRRLLALAVIYDGGRRSDAACFTGVGLQIIRDWVLRFNDMAARGVCEDDALGDLAGKRDHPRPHRRQHHRRQPARARHIPDFLDESADIAERPAGTDPHALMRGPVRHAYAEAEPPARDLVDERRRLRELFRLLEIDWRNRGGEDRALGDMGERVTETEAAERARHPHTGEAAPLDLAGEFQRCETAAGDGGEAESRQVHRAGPFHCEGRKIGTVPLPAGSIRA